VHVIFSNRTNAYENLAAEDLLLDDAEQHEPVVFVYRNDDSVVIGKNQNPWKECAVEKLNRMGVTLARRISGGGAVFHDSGNVNISCILPRERYHRCDMLQTFIAGLAGLGIKAELAGGTSLVVNGRKFSGNAFCYRREKVLHHGTFLWRADLEKLRAALIPDCPDIISRAVASVPMPVVNLSELLPGKTQEDVVQSILQVLSHSWGAAKDPEVTPFDEPEYGHRVEKMQTWAWLFGSTPDFEYKQNGNTWQVHRGRIQQVNGTPEYPLVGQPFACNMT